MPKHRTVTPEIFARMKEMRGAGKQLKDIAKETGFHICTISVWLNHGGKYDANKPPPASKPNDFYSDYLHQVPQTSDEEEDLLNYTGPCWGEKAKKREAILKRQMMMIQSKKRELGLVDYQ